MKYISKFMRVCALLVAVSACHATARQNITVINRTGVPVFGGIYLTNIGGKVINKLSTSDIVTIPDDYCWWQEINKPKGVSRIKHYHRLIFSTNKKDAENKILGNSGKNFTSHRIKQLSGDTELFYNLSFKNPEFKDPENKTESEIAKAGLEITRKPFIHCMNRYVGQTQSGEATEVAEALEQTESEQPSTISIHTPASEY